MDFSIEELETIKKCICCSINYGEDNRYDNLLEKVQALLVKKLQEVKQHCGS